MRAILLALLTCGCAVHVREARALQPNPRRALGSADELPTSYRLYIYQRSLHLPHDYQLRSYAQFAVISQDRVRFHVGVTRWDEDEANTAGWKAWAEDETGHRYRPTAREVPLVNRIQISWALYPYAPNSSWCQKPPCLSRIIPGYTAYEGEADYVFRDAQLLAPTRKALSFVMRRGNIEYRYTWRFGDGAQVFHYGRTHVDDEMGTIAVPGPYTDVAGTTYEWDRWK